VVVDPRLRLAVDASICWYDKVFDSHGIEHRVDGGWWYALGRPPALHSAAKSIAPWATAAQALDRVASYEHCSIADSFGSMEPSGFDLLFEARWLFRPASSASRGPIPDGWSSIRTPEDLTEWNRHADTTGVLVPGLLQSPDIDVLELRVGDELRAGFVAHAWADVVSLSNVWTVRALGPDWREPVHVIEAIHPGRAIVGYVRAGDLELAVEAGFVDVGPQRVWVR
jgi:hypothetical protein